MVNLNASVKKIAKDGRLTVPHQLVEGFDLEKPIYVVQSKDNSLTLVQRTGKRNSNKVVNTVKANGNGVVQLCTRRLLSSTSTVAMYNSTKKKDSVTISCL